MIRYTILRTALTSLIILAIFNTCGQESEKKVGYLNLYLGESRVEVDKKIQQLSARNDIWDVNFFESSSTFSHYFNLQVPEEIYAIIVYEDDVVSLIELKFDNNTHYYKILKAYQDKYKGRWKLKKGVPPNEPFRTMKIDYVELENCIISLWNVDDFYGQGFKLNGHVSIYYLRNKSKNLSEDI